jgi:putative transposase
VEQIVAVLKQVELGMVVADACRKMGISEQTFYRWKKQYGSLEPDQARELKQLQEENARLKKLVADLSLDKAILQDIAAKMYGPPRDCKAQASGGISSHKCIRPLASGLLLQPGRDEIRTRRSQ